MQGSIFDKGEGTGSDGEEVAEPAMHGKRKEIVSSKASRGASSKNLKGKGKSSIAAKHLKIGKSKSHKVGNNLADLPMSPKQEHKHDNNNKSKNKVVPF